MATEIHVHPREDFARLTTLLRPLLPNSLPIYRSLQLPHHYPNTVAVSTFASDVESLDGRDFAIAFYEFRGGSLSSGCMFSSLQLRESKSDGKAEGQILAVLSQLRALKPKDESELVFMVMTHSKISDFLRGQGVTREDIRSFPIASKYVYRSKDLRNPQRLQGGKGALKRFTAEMNKYLPDGLEYGFIQEKDVPRVLETNATIKFRDGLVGLPNVFIREIGSDKAVCWLFVTRQGSMGISHCEPEYRRRKLASFTGAFLSQAGFMNFSKPFPYALKDRADDGDAVVADKSAELGSYEEGTSREQIQEEWVHQDAFHENAAASNFMKNNPITWMQDSYWLLVDLGRVDDIISGKSRNKNRL